MLRTLPYYVSGLAILLLFFAGELRAQSAPAWPNFQHGESTPRLVVLRNGEVLQGSVATAGERVLVTLPGREISLRASEIDVVARTLEEAYGLKRAKLRPTDVDGRLDLAAWCIRHSLWDEARVELSAAGQIQPFGPRRVELGRRLEKALAADTVAHQTGERLPAPRKIVEQENVKQSGARSRDSQFHAKPVGYSWPPVTSAHASATETATRKMKPAKLNPARGTAPAESPAALERFMRSLPSSAVEQFTGGLQSMIAHGCATAGCHAPGNSTEFTLLRLPHGRAASRRLTQRNLYNTAQLVDFGQPEESRLLKIASQPHGPLPSGVFGDARSPKYQELVSWVSGLTGVAVNGGDGSKDHGIANMDWDRMQNAANRFGPLAQPADAESAADSAADELAPNRPAEIKGH